LLLLVAFDWYNGNLLGGPPLTTGLARSRESTEGGLPVTKELQELLDAAKNVEVSAEQKEEQRRSFAYGNTNIENSRITRETVDKEAEALKRK